MLGKTEVGFSPGLVVGGYNEVFIKDWSVRVYGTFSVPEFHGNRQFTWVPSYSDLLSPPSPSFRVSPPLPFDDVRLMTRVTESYG